MQGGFLITPNSNIKISQLGNTYSLVGTVEKTDIPAEYQGLFGDIAIEDTLNKYVLVRLNNIIPKDGATIVQKNEALKYYYDKSDINITEVDGVYTKTKEYDGTDSDYALLVKVGSTAEVTINGIKYIIDGSKLTD